MPPVALDPVNVTVQFVLMLCGDVAGNVAVILPRVPFVVPLRMVCTPVEKLRDLDYVGRVLARQRPAWEPGTRHGYHMMTLGLYMQELIRHVDPARRTLGQFFHEEIAVPLGLDFYIGLPRSIADERIARVRPLSPGRDAALRS